MKRQRGKLLSQLNFKEKSSNRVAGGFSPPAPTPPGMRVPKGRLMFDKNSPIKSVQIFPDK